MKIQLIDGHFSAADALELTTRMVQVKVRFLEDKIKGLEHEEDIKMREWRIKNLQNELAAVRKLWSENGSSQLHLHAVISTNEEK